VRKVSFFCFYGKLAQFRPIEDGLGKDFWEERWSRHNLAELHASYQTGKLDDFDIIFPKYLPKYLPVLEAGCGMGQLVVGLNARGYQAEGVDYAEQTIDTLHQVNPDLKVQVGDVYHLDAPDGHFGGYISIGIFEHNPDGPQDGLREVNRVLHPDGFAFISVPLLNQERRKWLFRAPVVDKTKTEDELVFYQYYYSIEKFTSLLKAADLEIVEIYPYALYSGLTRDIPLWKWLHEKGFFAWPIHHRFIRWCKNAPFFIRNRWAHMVMFVCKKST
jgi:SAM-dependent methyltransferase